jgi:hypothetical protein
VIPETAEQLAWSVASLWAEATAVMEECRWAVARLRETVARVREERGGGTGGQGRAPVSKTSEPG